MIKIFNKWKNSNIEYIEVSGISCINDKEAEKLLFGNKENEGVLKKRKII